MKTGINENKTVAGIDQKAAYPFNAGDRVDTGNDFIRRNIMIPWRASDHVHRHARIGGIDVNVFKFVHNNSLQ